MHNHPLLKLCETTEKITAKVRGMDKTAISVVTVGRARMLVRVTAGLVGKVTLEVRS